MSSSTNFPPPPTSSPPPPASPLHPPSELPESSITDLPLPLLPSPPPPPPLPPLPNLPTFPATPLPPPGLGKSPNHGVKVATHRCPLVTAQALQGVKLRSVKNQEGLLTSIMLANVASTAPDLPSKEAHPDNAVSANANLDCRANTDVNLDGAGSQNALCDLGSNEANITCTLMGNASLHIPANADAKQPGQKLDLGPHNLTKSDKRTPNDESSFANLQSQQSIVASPANQRCSGSKLTNGETPQEIQYDNQEKEHSNMYDTLANDPISSPWVKMSYGTDKNHINSTVQHLFLQQQVIDKILADAKQTEPAEKPENNEDVWHTDSSYWTLSGTKQESHRESRAIPSKSKDEGEANDKSSSEIKNHNAAEGDFKVYSDLKQSNRVFKSGSPRKLRSPEKPILPKKPDLYILGLMGSPEARQGPGGWKSNGQITTLSPGLSQSQLPDDSFCTPLHSHLTHSTPSPELSTYTSVDKTTVPNTSTLPEHSTNVASLPVNTTTDMTTRSAASSPQRQKPPILHKKPELSLTSPKKKTHPFPEIQVRRPKACLGPMAPWESLVCHRLRAP